MAFTDVSASKVAPGATSSFTKDNAYKRFDAIGTPLRPETGRRAPARAARAAAR